MKYFRLKTDFEIAQKKADEQSEEYLKVTSRMFRTVFTEIKKNIPFDSHSFIVRLQQFHGVNMGNHHYDKCAAIRMMESMSAHMHNLMLQHMVSRDLPFTIILDGSDDITDSHFMIVYFQILENDVPVMCFYRLIETTSDVSALGYFNSIKKAMLEEKVPIYDYFQRNLVGYVSDGAPVMIGSEGGLISYVQRVTNNPIFTVHCMAHKLHLAITKAYVSIEYFKTFDSIINDLYKFYNSYSSKRKTHLRETAQGLNIAFYELNYIYRTRWISSEFHAINNFKRMWLSVTSDLKLISNDRSFKVEIRDKARSILNKILGKNFLVILNFVFDVLEHLSFWSQKLQQKTAMLVDFTGFVDNITLTFETLKVNNGKGLALLLEHSMCDGIECESIEEFYDSEHLKYQNVELINDRGYDEDIVPFLYEIRDRFLNDIISQIKQYFPVKELSLFKIFAPSEFPTNIAGSLSYGVREISNLCRIFKLKDCEDLLIDWAKLIESIISHEYFCELRSGNTETYVFWSRFLKFKSINWTLKTKQLIRTVLVIPIGSADAERGFSIMNHIKHERRARLTSKHLEDAMRIRINTEDEIEKFPAQKYAKLWVAENHLRTDDETRIHTKKSLNQKKYFPKLTFL